MNLISTNDDATACRNSAVKAGYFEDDYVKYFTRRSKTSPLINRGTALRTLAINFLMHQFTQRHSQVQIISLGGGFDTRFFNTFSNLCYWEIDFAQVIAKKIMIIQKTKELYSCLENVKVENGDLNSDTYHLISGDLRDSHKTIQKLIDLGLNTQIPTLILSECCLIYLDTLQSTNLIKDFCGLIQNCAFLVYEQINPNDAFGKMMIQNLFERGITLHGILAFPTLDSQIERYKSLGFKNVNGWNMNQALEEFVSKDLLDKWNKLERLDELEEWNLFCSHYFVLLAQKN